jgi:hypothetical protein
MEGRTTGRTDKKGPGSEPGDLACSSGHSNTCTLAGDPTEAAARHLWRGKLPEEREGSDWAGVTEITRCC